MNPKITELKEKIRLSDSFTKGYSSLLVGESVLFDGMIGNSSLLISSVLAEDSSKLLLLICPNIGDVETAADDLTLFTDSQILTYPVLPSFLTENSVRDSEIFLSEDRIFGKRLSVLKELRLRSATDFGLSSISPSNETNFAPLENHIKRRTNSLKTDSFKTPPAILVTSLAAIRQPVPTKDDIEAGTRVLEVNKTYDRSEIFSWLTQHGFHSTSAVELPGEFSVRGGILDIYAVDWFRPVRIEFFDDDIESIRYFDTKTQRSTEDIPFVEISGLRLNRKVNGHFTDHLPISTIVVMLETGDVIRQATKIDRFFQEKNKDKDVAHKSSITKTSTNDIQAMEHLDISKEPISIEKVCNALYRYATLHLVTISSGNEFATHSYSFLFQTVNRLQGKPTLLRKEIDRYPEKIHFDIVCRNEAEQRRVADSLSESEVMRQGRVNWMIGFLTHGFAWPEQNIVLIGSDELFRRMHVRRSRARTLSQSIDSFVDLSPGDLVIHVGHGLARFRGLIMLEKGRQEEEHLELEFADNVILYVPTSKIYLIQKYVGTSQLRPKLAKLNGKAWNKQKQEVRNAVFDLAADMIELQAKREALQGIAFPPDTDWQLDFDESFPFQPTEDQLVAIETIKSDMEKSRPMDRLLCGDVGFGKTEVAIRAAFKAVNAGYQVAVLVPTTILAEQHFHVFSERMSSFPIRLGILSRFCSKAEITQTLEKLRAGEIDIIIGTHRLVQKDVIFKNLGLAIIDEEQRFGVRDKDFLKHLRSQVDVLTMTATPIPRTLHFSLLGLRDISNLQTPPDDRLPIETKVLRFNPEVIRSGILFEMSRGGQVYFLHNQVKDIDLFAHKLMEIVPEAKIGVGHAQMSDGDLEKVLRKFINREYDVLLSTTIIENGIDIPNANTIFINHANRFGLAELHQLRGRVGRFKNQAYCYLLLSPNAPMTHDSMQRLKAIEEYSQLGAGFQLALRDLELRGAGNILGVQQSGHINLVGYEMYCEFLESAIRLLKQMPQKVKIEVAVDLPGVVMIPNNYVPEVRDKLDLYRRLSRITTEEEADSIQNEINDRFGKLPRPVERLIICAKIRVAAWQHSIRTVNLVEFPQGSYIAFSFKSLQLVNNLKKDLFASKIDLRVLNEEKAVIPIPRSIYDEVGEIDTDRLLYYVLNILKG